VAGDENAPRIGLYSGDWRDAATVLPRNSYVFSQERVTLLTFLGSPGASRSHALFQPRYDVILTAETVYELETLPHLAACIARLLRPGGVALVAAKTYYFGVGGGIRDFERAARECGLAVGPLRRYSDGASNVREIVCATRAAGDDAGASAGAS